METPKTGEYAVSQSEGLLEIPDDEFDPIAS